MKISKKIISSILITTLTLTTVTPAFAQSTVEDDLPIKPNDITIQQLSIKPDITTQSILLYENSDNMDIVSSKTLPNDLEDSPVPASTMTSTTLWEGPQTTSIGINKYLQTPNFTAGDIFTSRYMSLYVKNTSPSDGPSIYVNITEDNSILGGTYPIPGGSTTLAPDESWRISVPFEQFVHIQTNTREYGYLYLKIYSATAGAQFSVNGSAIFYTY